MRYESIKEEDYSIAVTGAGIYIALVSAEKRI